MIKVIITFMFAKGMNKLQIINISNLLFTWLFSKRGS